MYQQEAICEIGKKDRMVAAITAAMPDGVGLTKFSKWFPDRFFDVGIAEAHAVTFAAGLAAGGLKPVFAVYSSFLQRAYDQILHDVCIQQLHVVFAIDRAGLVGSDGETHQGMLIRLTEMVMELSDTYLQSVTSDTMIPSHVHVVFVRHLEQELRMVTKLLPSRQEQT